MLNETQAFRAGFLMRCAEEGLSDAEIAARVGLAKQANTLGSAMLFPLLVGGSLGTMLGASAGVAARDSESMVPQKPEIVSDIHKAELAATFRQQAEALRRQAASIRRRQQAPIRRSQFGI